MDKLSFILNMHKKSVSLVTLYEIKNQACSLLEVCVITHVPVAVLA